MLYGDEHVRRYQETDGQEGHDWNGTTVLILTTTGRKSGEQRSSALIYREYDGGYLVVASNGGGPPPAWSLNLQADPQVHVQVGGDRFAATARTATAAEKPEVWSLMTEAWPQYDEYQAKADREIPVVVLERA